jgi:hypothetical protein
VRQPHSNRTLLTKAPEQVRDPPQIILFKLYKDHSRRNLFVAQSRRKPNLLRRYAMNGRSQMQGGKNCMDFPERYQCKPVLLRLSLVGNLEKPLFPLYETEWRERGYGLGGRRHGDSELNATKYLYDCFLFLNQNNVHPLSRKSSHLGPAWLIWIELEKNLF